MKIRVICVGKVKEVYMRRLIEEYTGELKKRYDFEVIELEDEKTPDHASEKEMLQIKEKEGKRILEKIPESSYVIPLCIEGKQLTTEELKKQWMILRQANQTIVFIIGGSLGLSADIVKKGRLKLSFSRMTFPHQWMRVMLLEQILRL